MGLAANVLKFSKLCVSYNSLSKYDSIHNQFFIWSIRGTKHWNPKFKWFRQKKVIPVELPDEPNLKLTKETKEKRRSYLKQMGILPPPEWKERPITITSATEIIDPYDPPKGDGKASFLSKESATNLFGNLKGKQKSMSAISKIKKYESDFKEKIFPQYAQDIYIKAHTLLMKKDPEQLSEYVTERANVQMMEGVQNRTIRWKFIKSLEPPVVVQARVAPVIKETNLFAQLTVRFHTQQSLAIYDRFGRLCYGSEILAKDVLEFIVFEKHINNVYGTWRLHAKIIPDWVSSGEFYSRTYTLAKQSENLNDDDDDIPEEWLGMFETEDTLQKTDDKILDKKNT